MNRNERTLDDYLYENRISPTPAFTARIDAVCEGIRQSEAHADHAEEMRPSPKPLRRHLKWLIPAAALVIAMVTLLSIPAVSQAITDWFNEVTRVNRYMRLNHGDVAYNPDIEQAILEIPAADQVSEILLLPEFPATEGYSYEEIDGWRVERGQPAFSEADWGWIRDIVPTVKNVLYDGTNIIITIFYETDPVPFAHIYFGSDGARSCSIECVDYDLVVNGETMPKYSWSYGLDFSEWYEKSRQPGFAITDVREDGGVTAHVTIDLPVSPVLPDGICDATLTMTVQDAHTDDTGWAGMVGQITHRFSFDTTIGNRLVQSVPLETIAFQGDAVVTVRHQGNLLENPSEDDDVRGYDMRGNRIEPDGERWVCNQALSLDGMTVTPIAHFRPTGINVQLPYVCPDAWDYDTQNAVMAALKYELIVDGVSQDMVFCEGLLVSPYIEISLTPTELQQVESIVLRPYVERLTTWDEGVPLPLGQRIDLATQPRQTSPTRARVPLTGCDIVVLPLP